MVPGIDSVQSGVPAAWRELDRAFVDRRGRTVRFRCARDADGPNRGFVVDRMEAFAEGRAVGRISCEYMTRESFGAFHPTVFNFMDQVAGKLVMPRGSETLDLRSAGPDVLGEVAERLVRYRIAQAPPASRPADYAAFRRWLAAADTFGSMAREEAGYAAFSRRIAYPFVAYVSTREGLRRGDQDDNSRLGIGSELYRAMAAELALRGMALRASRLQTPSAAAVWSRFEREGEAVREPDRLQDGTRLRLLAPQVPRPAH